MASIPPLPEASDLTGRWSVEEPGGHRCALVFHAEKAGDDHRLEADAGCLQALGLPGVAAWRPAPDGIALADTERRTVAFFSTEAVRRYVARRRDGRTLVLTPAG